MTGYVRPAQLVFSPRSISFGSPRRTETASREVLIPSFEQDKIEIISVSPNTPYVTVQLSQTIYKELPGYVLTATLKPGAPLGELKSKIIINSNHPRQPKAEIPMTATIRGNIDLNRDSFFLGLLKKGQTRSAAVTVSTVGKDPLKITKLGNPLSYLAVDVSPKIEGKECVLTATLKPDAPPGNIKGEVTVHTNDPDQPEIRIAVYAYIEE